MPYIVIWAGAALAIPARLRRIRVGSSDSVRTKPAEGVVSPVARPHGYLGKLESDKKTLTARSKYWRPRSIKRPVDFGVIRSDYLQVRVFGGETAQLLRLVVVLATEPRHHNNTII